MKFNEKEALLQIRDEGKKLSEFHLEDYEWEQQPKHWPTRLMVLAALTHHGVDAYLEVPEKEWTQRTAKMAVTANYRAISAIPDALKQHCVIPFTNHYLKQDRASMIEYKALFRQQSDIFRSSCISFNPGLSDDKNDMMRRYENKKLKVNIMAPKKDIGNYVLDFTDDEEFSSVNELTPERFLSLPTKEQTEEKLRLLLQSDMDFPGDFIKKISIPRRNAMYYEKLGDMETANYWKGKILPYLNKELCLLIAEKHPEAALSAAPYLTKEAIKAFWERKKESCSGKELALWFVRFPEDMLDAEMIKDIPTSRAVLSHAPSLYKDTEEAKKHLLRNPNDVLYLPQYQTPGFLLLDGVNLNKQTVEMIENENFREKTKIALNLQ